MTSVPTKSTTQGSQMTTTPELSTTKHALEKSTSTEEATGSAQSPAKSSTRQPATSTSQTKASKRSGIPSAGARVQQFIAGKRIVLQHRCTAHGCRNYMPEMPCQCDSKCAQYDNCCANYRVVCQTIQAHRSSMTSVPAKLTTQSAQMTTTSELSMTIHEGEKSTSREEATGTTQFPAKSFTRQSVTNITQNEASKLSGVPSNILFKFAVQYSDDWTGDVQKLLLANLRVAGLQAHDFRRQQLSITKASGSVLDSVPTKAAFPLQVVYTLP